MLNQRGDFYMTEREKGKTYQSIADQFGVSRQCVHNACKRYKQFVGISPTRCVYIGLRKWLNENRMKISDVSRLMNTCGFDIRETTLRKHLSGKHELTIGEIKCLMAVTGKTFEELFAT